MRLLCWYYERGMENMKSSEMMCIHGMAVMMMMMMHAYVHVEVFNNTKRNSSHCNAIQDKFKAISQCNSIPQLVHPHMLKFIKSFSLLLLGLPLIF